MWCRRTYAWCAVACSVLFLVLILQTPKTFTPNTLISIPSGSSLHDAGEILKKNNIIVSSTMLRVAISFMGGADSVKAGDYLFREQENIVRIAWRLAKGDYRLMTVRVLIPEGTTSFEMGDILARVLPRINPTEFEAEARPFEGYLFPDTYFFLPTVTSSEVIEVMRNTFIEKTALLAESQLPDGATSWSDVVTMASIIEEEARGEKDKQIVSGILWKRIREEHALQVDAPFYYLFGKASHELDAGELEFDSPYNTYLYRGLPPTPISNPGIESLEASLKPTETPYWFYLTGNDGIMHYATTFEEHKENKRLYLQ